MEVVGRRLTPGRPQATIPARQGGWEVAATYLKLGVEHILLGIDHLLFVLALILIAPNTRQLILAITTFTVAHSITLAAATFGFVNAPLPPVAAIALSIAFVAAEIIRAREGKAIAAARPGSSRSRSASPGRLARLGSQPVISRWRYSSSMSVSKSVSFSSSLSCWALPSFPARSPPLPRWATLAPPYLIGSSAMFR